MSKDYEINIESDIVHGLIASDIDGEKVIKMIELLDEFKSLLNKDKHELIKSNLTLTKQNQELKEKISYLEADVRNLEEDLNKCITEHAL